MEENLKATIEKIKLLAKQNSEFAKEMQLLFGKSVEKTDLPILASVSDNVIAIRSALEIRANASITYDFINEQRLRDQLIIDNLRMENAALNLVESEANRFYTFCVNAFYQIENLVNYYYYKSFPNIEDLLYEIEQCTQSENEGFRYKRTNKEINVSSIPVAHKINAFCNSLIPDDKSLKWLIGTLRQVRNEGEHRCAIIRENQDENNNLYRFFKTNTFNSVRANLIKFVSIAKQNLLNPALEEKQEAIISNVLPSACYVLLNNQSIAIPLNLFNKVKHLQKGDKILLSIKNGKILDIVNE